ncbi:MAG: formylglycine-generating enzyme family protein, partial [Candidatus Latescibacterota bacterium]
LRTIDSNQCRIRISDIVNAGTFDESNAAFTVNTLGQAAWIKGETPKMDDLLTTGETYTISWKQALVNKVRLEYTRDNGRTWTLIATNIAPGTTKVTGENAYQGSYSWKAPDVVSSEYTRVRATDMYNPKATGETLTFTLLNPNISMVNIPAGEFMMGSNTNEVIEVPAHPVRLNAFQISATQVTRLQYHAVTGGSDGGYPANLSPAITGITWIDAARFCNLLSDRAGLARCYDETTWACDFTRNGYRLPTEAEWEYACRAGTQYDPTDTELESMAWTNWEGYGVKTVASKRPNSWVLYDMLGNGLEYCNDWYERNTKDAVVNPTGPSSGSQRIIRGGVYKYKGDFRPSWRYFAPPSHALYGGGTIRVVRKAVTYAKDTP